jgi:hypothetical protein
MFQLRPPRAGETGHRLIYRYPFRSPEVCRAVPVIPDPVPNTVQIGLFTRDGFRPSRRWLPLLRIPSVRDRICEDMETLYGPGGPYASDTVQREESSDG